MSVSRAEMPNWLLNKSCDPGVRGSGGPGIRGSGGPGSGGPEVRGSGGPGVRRSGVRGSGCSSGNAWMQISMHASCYMYTDMHIT